MHSNAKTKALKESDMLSLTDFAEICYFFGMAKADPQTVEKLVKKIQALVE